MRSMTGFGQGTAESERLRATVTLRGVNHRFFDLVTRLRDEYRPLEPTLRELVARHVSRGRLELGVEIETLIERGVDVTVDQALAEALQGVQDRLRQRGVIEQGLVFADLLRLPEVIRIHHRETEWSDDDRDVVLAATSRALEQLVTARETEGGKLRGALVPRLDGIAEAVDDLLARRAAVAADLGENLRRRIRELLAGENAPESLTEDRLAVEVALLVDKSDVSEELDRLASHLEHFRGVMDEAGSLGKRLDFLTQEIFRELNTLGAKCRDSEMIRRVLDAKVLCEQIREQIQNVE